MMRMEGPSPQPSPKGEGERELRDLCRPYASPTSFSEPGSKKAMPSEPSASTTKARTQLFHSSMLSTV